MDHAGPKSYLRLDGPDEDGVEQGKDTGIDQTWLNDQIPLLTLQNNVEKQDRADEDRLVLIEVQQFREPKQQGIDGIDTAIQKQLTALNVEVSHHLHFGRDAELPSQDSLDFSRLESWSQDLVGAVWDPNSLSSFWFELVNGAYGDVYRAKALMNLPDGRAFFCNWIVSQQGSQFLPLEAVAPPDGRPQRMSQLVVQGKALNPDGIQITIDDCLISNDVLELHQAPIREQSNQSTLLSR